MSRVTAPDAVGTAPIRIRPPSPVRSTSGTSSSSSGFRIASDSAGWEAWHARGRATRYAS
ncbi:hypothetical protein [Streptomyces sp. NPDC093071]|uniref:hypothetical protein n=1 Tax=Streptomyces sp. NPDC093071 TaxID=3366022 RepID=UPI0038291E42